MRLVKHEDYADVIPIGEFILNVEEGLFTSYDGTGYYGNSVVHDLDCPAIPKEIYDGVSDSKHYTHVAWFNK